MVYKNNDQVVRDFIHDRLYYTTDVLNNVKRQKPFDEVKAIQNGEHHPQVKKFFQLALNRRLMGAYRYGTFKDNENVDPKNKIPQYMIEKIENYIITGNLEMLIDVTNYCLLEFLHGKHPKRHFKSEDDIHHIDVWRFNK